MFSNNPFFINQNYINPDTAKYTAHISSADLAKIIQKYGNQIEDIYNLGPGQDWMFHEKRNNRSAFFLQILLKAEMKLRPIDFNGKVNTVCESNETLRFAYAHKGLEKPYCVCLKDRRAEVSYDDISGIDNYEIDRMLDKYCEADRRRGFDLENDPLLRIHIYKLKAENNYAIIISQPHINSDGTSIGILIKDLFIDYVLNINPEVLVKGHNEYKNIAMLRDMADITKELDYWKKYLSGLTDDIELPGRTVSNDEFKETLYAKSIPGELYDSLKAAPKKYKSTVYNIIQAAWGIMLYRITGNQDIVFGAITSGRDARLFDSMTIPGGFVKVVPVRLRLRDDMMFNDVVSGLQKDFVQSMENSDCSLEEIKTAIGRKEELFNHILNCHNFEGNQSFSSDGVVLPGFKIMGASVYDNLSEDLAVYIRSGKSGMSLVFGYNESVFSKETIELYAECFTDTLRQILFRDNDVAVGDLNVTDASAFEYTAKLHQFEVLKMTMLMKKHQIFMNAKWDDLMDAVCNARITTFFSADTIFKEKDVLSHIYIIISGVVEIKAATNGGWKNPIKVCRAGSMVGISGLLTNKRTPFEVAVISDEATVLSIPSSDVKALIKKYPGIGQTILDQLYTESTRFIKMWINT